MPDETTNAKSEHNTQTKIIQKQQNKKKGKTTKGRAGKKSDGERTNVSTIFMDGSRTKFVRKVLCGVMQRPPAVLP